METKHDPVWPHAFGEITQLGPGLLPVGHCFNSGVVWNLHKQFANTAADTVVDRSGLLCFDCAKGDMGRRCGNRVLTKNIVEALSFTQMMFERFDKLKPGHRRGFHLTSEAT